MSAIIVDTISNYYSAVTAYAQSAACGTKKGAKGTISVDTAVGEILYLILS
jgi:hypothetical protein